MNDAYSKLLDGYKSFREKYVFGDSSIMHSLAKDGQQPKTMVIACCDSRVDPALILQCDPGDLFVVRNVANIVPPFEKDNLHHGTSAALEFAVQYLHIENLILLGHSQCGGIQALVNNCAKTHNDFITNWVSQISLDGESKNPDEVAKSALLQSEQNCLSFPWIKDKVEAGKLTIHLWFFDIKPGKIFEYQDGEYRPLENG